MQYTKYRASKIIRLSFIMVAIIISLVISIYEMQMLRCREIL